MAEHWTEAVNDDVDKFTLPSTVVTDAAKFDSASPGVFSEGAVKTWLAEYLNAISGWPASKASEMGTLINKHPKWPACHGSVKQPAGDTWMPSFAGSIDDTFQKHVGAIAWMLTIRKFAYLWGPSRHGTLGLAQAVHSPVCDLWVTLIDTKEVLDAGITLNHVDTYFAQNSFETMFNASESVVFPVPKGSVAYIPHGLIPIVSHYSLDKSVDLGYYMSVPIFSVEEFKKSVPANVAQAICVFNMKWLKQQTKDMYANRVEVLTAFFGAVGVEVK